MNETETGVRRPLRFDSLEALLEEIDRVVEADRAGRIETLGSWTPGQILGHLAAWIEYGYEGYPMKPLPWPVRTLLRWRLSKYLDRGMPIGVRIPGVEGGTYGTEPSPTEEAAERLRLALGRLQRREPARYASPAFGKLSMDDQVRLCLRHAELHLSFLRLG